MYNRETHRQNKFQIIPGLRDAFGMSPSQGVIRILAAFILFFSIVISSTGQELITKPEAAEAEGFVGVPFWEGGVKGDGDRAITDPAPYCKGTHGSGTSYPFLSSRTYIKP